MNYQSSIATRRAKAAEEQATRLRIQRRRIRRMHEIGYSHREIANSMGIAESTVRLVLPDEEPRGG